MSSPFLRVTTKFAIYERWMWTSLSYLTVCRYYIGQDSENGQYVIHKAGRIRLFLYYFLWINSVLKIGYLIVAYQGWILEVGFLEQMSMWDWFVAFTQLIQETHMWIRKAPLYEILICNWKVQEDVFRKLGSPKDVEDRIFKTCRSLVRMHTTVVLVGVVAIAVQYFYYPTNPLNTIAIFPPVESYFLRLLFTFHEAAYVFHIWVHQASSIVLIEVFSVTYTHVLAAMGDVLGSLAVEGNKVATRIPSSRQQFIPDRILNPKTLAPGTEYTILGLLEDYKRIMIAVREFNNWAGKCMGGTMMSNYGQFVCDVFMAIQLLKEPETDVMGVIFYFEDACAGMLILFRMLILMSRMSPQSQLFLRRFKDYLQQGSPLRGYLRRYQKTLRVVATKIGGYSTNPTTVPKGINALMNYYIAAAMWQRPIDPSRRT